MSELKSFSIELIKKCERPLTNLHGLTALIDTGAIIPVFSMSEDDLKEYFNAHLKRSDIYIGGIGGRCDGDVYVVKNFQIGEMIFENMDVFVPKDITPFEKKPIMLSATLFFGTKYEIDTINSKFTVTYPEDFKLIKDFNILDLRGKIYAQIDGVLLQEDDMGNYQVYNYTQSDIGYEKIIDYTEDNIDNSLDNIINDAFEDSGLQNELVNDNFDNVENNSTDVINDNVEIDSNNIEGSYDDMDYDDDDEIDRE